MATTLKSSSKRSIRATRKETSTAKLENNIERPIWERVAELGAQIPDSEWQKVPDDSSINFKSYADKTLPKRG